MTGQTGQRIINGVEVWAPDIMTLSPDGRFIVMSFARFNGRGGIASLDVGARSIAHFAPFVPRAGLSTIGPGFFPGGAIVVAGARDSTSRTRSIYFLRPDDLIVLDSIDRTVAGMALDTLQQVVPAGAGDVLFLNMGHQIARFDMRSRSVTAVAAKPVEGAVWLSQDAAVLVLPDGGLGPDSPGTGRVYVFDASTLQLRGTIGLPQSSGGGPRVSDAVATGLVPNQMYLVTGTARIGPNYPVDPAALLLLDISELSVKRVVPLNDWAVGRPYTY